MVLALLVSLLSGQVIYEWVDSKGESHFTDDVSTIPAKAKRRVTTGVEPVISVPRSPDAGQVAAPKPPPVAPARPSGPDSCERARKQIQDVEQQAQREQADFEQRQANEDKRCTEAMNLFGREAFARCMAGRTQAPPPSTAPQRLEEARDALRRAQIDGCK